ncbi:hypothetical protein CR203_02130 [Salipaludibacillus neizhouensis]|uniref:Small peptidoglycan-associated lipoprotein n=1 Tax=Salipaludibacillus neizhouensis TaxID=885475 RepID=A0A3A9KH29_9BACI|nr:hypothetical protein [Salipaludibacillus neizhouensis]RKL68863.1 hypothetical protein CR203_02130 [Salipaludibacillus neizhouensis]
MFKRLIPFIAITLMLVFVSSCNQQSTISTSYPFLENSKEDNSPVTILFSNEHDDINSEHDYYDALINFRQDHPNKLSQLNIISNDDEEIVNYFDIKSFPTLLIVDDLEVIMQIDGQHDFQSIYNKLKVNLLSLKERAS